MSMSITRLTGRASRALMLVAAVTAVAGAQAASPDAIMQRYAKAIDPQGKVATIAGLTSTATVDMPAQGMTMTVKSMQRRPDHVVTTLTIPGLGEMRTGYDGETAWALDPMQGPRLLAGAEAQQLRDQASFAVMVRDRSSYDKAESAGETQVDGETADCVKVTWKGGRVSTDCYSRSSGLLLESRSTTSTPQGEIEAVTRLYDYKAVDGILMPHRIVNQAMGMVQNITMSETRFGAMPAEAFELPAEIKALKKP